MGIYYRDFLRPGGIPRETLLLAKALQRHVGHVVVYCSDDLSGDVHPDDLEVKAFRPPRRHRIWPMAVAPALLKTLAKNLDRLDVALVVGTFIPENAAVGTSLRRGKIPYVISIGAGYHPALWRGRKGRIKAIYDFLFERRFLSGAAALRLYSDDQRDHLLARGHETRDSDFVAKEGIDWDFMSEWSSREPSWTYRGDSYPQPLFGFLGRLSPYEKGLDVLSDAWRIYTHQGGEGTLLLAGPEVPGWSVDMEITRVKHLGVLEGPEKVEFLRGLTCLIQASRHEGIPRATREALALGCPVIITPNTNLHDLVTAHNAGIVVNLDPKELAEAMTRMATTTNLQDFKDGALSAASNLSWDRIAEEMSDRLAALAGVT